jgi:hypothetical protein
MQAGFTHPSPPVEQDVCSLATPLTPRQQPHPAKQGDDGHLFAPYPRVVDVVQGLLEPERLEAEKDDTPVNNDRCSCVNACFAAASSVPWRLLASTEA